MKCKNCGKEIDFIPPVLLNVETYGGCQTAVSRCCGVAYKVRRVIKYDIEPYIGENEEDSWGNEIKTKFKN